MWGVKLLLGETSNTIRNGRWGHTSGLLQLLIAGRRPWAVWACNFITGKGWQGNIMIFGLHFVSYLEQPDIETVPEDTKISDVNWISIRQWSWGFNYFQSTGKPDETE